MSHNLMIWFCPIVHPWASLVPVAIWLTTGFISGSIVAGRAVSDLLYFIQMRPIYRLVNDNWVDHRLIASFIVAGTACYNFVIIVVRSQHPRWYVARTLIHALAGVLALALYGDYYRLYGQPIVSASSVNNIGVNDTAHTGDIAPPFDDSFVYFGLFPVHFLLGLVVLPSRAFKATLFTPLIAGILCLLRRLSLGVCACSCWPAKWRQDVEEALDTLEGKKAGSEEEDGEEEEEEEEGNKVQRDVFEKNRNYHKDETEAVGEAQERNGWKKDSEEECKESEPEMDETDEKRKSEDDVVDVVQGVVKLGTTVAFLVGSMQEPNFVGN